MFIIDLFFKALSLLVVLMNSKIQSIQNSFMFRIISEPNEREISFLIFYFFGLLKN